MWRLEGAVRPYAWGSRIALATLQGRPSPTPEPEAELWLGAHPDDPASVDGRTLLDAIVADPPGVLGSDVVGVYGARLPYLLKVLAADQPLSLQAHPDADQARAAFEAGNPNYTDPYHKPEMLVAVTEFEALCGFRDPIAASSSLAVLGVAGLAPAVDSLMVGDMCTAVTWLLRLPERMRRALVGEVVVACDRLTQGPDSAACSLAVELGTRYPGDIGVVCSLLLNHVRLAPGQAVYLPA